MSSGTDRSMREIAEGLVRRSGSKISFTSSTDLLRPVDTPVLLGSAQLLYEHTGWQPQIPFEQSLDDIYQDAVDNLDLQGSDS